MGEWTPGREEKIFRLIGENAPNSGLNTEVRFQVKLQVPGVSIEKTMAYGVMGGLFAFVARSSLFLKMRLGG